MLLSLELMFDVQLRLYLMGGILSDEYWGNQFQKLHDYGKHGRLNLRSIKLMADGTYAIQYEAFGNTDG
jgi:hypothetical protein